MSELMQDPVENRPHPASVRPDQVAEQQWGIIGHGQLQGCGLSNRAIARWRASGKLHEQLPRVYAFGHRSVPVEGELVAALLYAGDGAVLSHRTAGWWWGLIDERPARIEISRRSRTCSLPEVLIHHPRELESTRHRRFPITTVAQTLLDFAAQAPLNEVRLALARAEYLKLLDCEAAEAVLGRGRHGSRMLRKALERHLPILAETRSRTERSLLVAWERTGMELPEVNPKLHGWTVDFLWRAHGLVVETDGHGNHHTPAQIDRDRRKDLTLRGHGLTVNRYSRQQVEERVEVVIADVKRTLEQLAARRTA